jgi:trafficking protein particle complex subunit 8
LIVRAFSPTVAIYASEDTDEIARYKGFKNGFVDIVRPYGERVSGKVVVRDSVGASRAWDDFGVHFRDLGQLAQTDIEPSATPLDNLEELLEQYLEQPQGGDEGDINSLIGDASYMSQYYRLFLSRLLSASQFSQHESFLHPSACVIAISSHTPNPIETLRQLYAQTAHGNRTLPMHANPDYLRYYVLVHDEERSDFSKSSALFDQMKRHFGLHCHLLRLRSSPCTPTDDDAVELPQCERLSPAEDLSRLQETENLIDLGSPSTPHIFDSDAQAIRSFVRELVAQSVVPHMENRIANWNEQVAARRRGISGRFMSLSKRWTGIGTGSRNTTLATGRASGNYDALQGTYHYNTQEATLRKMADYAFMLRDYKLAASTYELLRTDFGNDKAWKYLAGANEMGVVAALLNPLASGKSMRVENFEPMLETATYSYMTRCADPVDTARCVMLAFELLKVRRHAAGEIAARWAIRLLGMGVLGTIGRVLVSERVACCFAGINGIGGDGKSWGWGRRKRKARLWTVMAADEWMKLGRVDMAERRLEDAEALYEEVYGGKDEEWKGFQEMQGFVQQLRLAVRIKRGQARRRGKSEAERAEIEQLEQEEERMRMRETAPMEQLERLDTRVNRRSLIGGPAAHPLDMPPLSPARMNRAEPLFSTREDDDFE